MRGHTVLARSYRRTQTARRVTPGATFSRTFVRSNTAVATPQHSRAPAPSSVPTVFQSDPYLDYGRFLTPDGGVLILYKDVDERFRRTLWRLFAWTAFTIAEGYFLYGRSPLQIPWINIACFIVVALTNWLVVRRPVEVYRNIEIRPDGLIIEGQEIFWRRFMEKWPAFRPDKNGHQILSGIYGTRFVEFLTVRRFDDHDRMPEIFAAHLQGAMKQLWTGRH
jgi:hypothetical protein